MPLPALAQPRPFAARMPARAAERGAATLIIVMVLFLVMALLAAYANRSLVFEQRISGSYYRASMAQELAEGGMEWALAMSNSTGIDDNCQPVATGGERFIDRYITVSAADRDMKARNATVNQRRDVVADCAQTPTGLVCRCPARGTRTAQPTTAEAGALVPSVGISMGIDDPTFFGSFGVRSLGCSYSSVDQCRDTRALSQRAAATSVQTAALAIIGAVPSSPASPLTVRGTLTTAGSGGLGLHNTDARSGGLLVLSGGPMPALDDGRMDSLPGTPAHQMYVFDEPTLKTGSSQGDRDRLFQTFLGIKPASYRHHPALRVVACTAGDCGLDLETAYNAGKRIVWIDGDMTIASNRDIGTVTDPMLIIVNGNATLDGAMKLTGMLVVQGDLVWNNGSSLSLITGSVVVTGDMATDGRMDIRYMSGVADQLRNRIGSYARVPGGWIDTDMQ
ncbi:MAG TPA: PilX N-terminal domain-containing pilus assembly protein [Roseateles sp.]|uniref:pilus assembly PilX family protein n=1 Tax=Roseateles sp. TaxID=1971397 RepID=UPI002ED94C7B